MSPRGCLRCLAPARSFSPPSVSPLKGTSVRSLPLPISTDGASCVPLAHCLVLVREPSQTAVSAPQRPAASASVALIAAPAPPASNFAHRITALPGPCDFTSAHGLRLFSEHLRQGTGQWPRECAHERHPPLQPPVFSSCGRASSPRR